MIPLVIIIAYLTLLLVLGGVAGRLFRGTSQDYMLASHSIGPFLLLMSLFGTTMTAFALVGSSGEAYKEGVGVYGQLASSSGIIHSLCFFVVGIKLWSFGKRYGYRTQIEFFRDRLESDKIGLLLFPILVGMVIPYLLIGVISAGTVISSITEGAFPKGSPDWIARHDYGVPPWLGSLVICIVVLIYVFFGGMRGTAWANAFQTIVFMILGVVTFFVISDKMGGVKAASEAVLEKNPSKLKREVTSKEMLTYEQAMGRWKRLAYYNFAVNHQGFQFTEEEIQQAYKDYAKNHPGPSPPWKKPFDQKQAEADHAARLIRLPKLSAEDRQRAFVEQDDRILPDPLPDGWTEWKLTQFDRDPNWQAEAEKLYAKQIGHPSEEGKMTYKQAHGRYRALKWAPEEPHGIDQWLFLTYLFIPLSVGMFPHLFQHWLTAKSASSFKLPVVAHPIFIMIVWVPCVLVGVWATSAKMPDSPAALVPPHFNPNAVLAYMVKLLTNDLLGGFLTAGILAAIMSSLDSQFLCIGTMFTEDIATHYGGKKKRFTDKQTVLMARLFVVGIVLVTYFLSLMGVRRVFTLGVWCFSGFASLFPLVLAAIYWRRLTKSGAYACVLAAAGSWAYLFYESNFAKNVDYSVDFEIAGNTIRTMPVATMIVCSTVAMILVSAITPKPSDETIRKFFKSEGE